MRAINKHKHFSKSFSWFSHQGSVLKEYCSNLSM
jgi:hypothetical protein